MVDYIDSNEKLERLASAIEGVPLLGIDTEFVGERNYYPKLALIQIAADDKVWLVDPLAVGSLDLLKAPLSDDRTIVLMHDAEIDLQILHRACGATVPRLFDTQLAAAFAGLSEAMGLSSLVRRFLGKKLSKGQQVSKWLSRPLSDKQKQYAAQDVIYLASLYKVLDERLRKVKRNELFWEEIGHRRERWLKPVDVSLRFRNILTSPKVSPDQQLALKTMLEWRENMAQQRDIPRRHVMSDEAICAVADQRPSSIDELKTLRLVSEKAVKRYGGDLVDLSLQLRSSKLKSTALPIRRQRNGKRLKARIHLMKIALEVLASEVRIAPGLIARVDELEAICRHAAHSDTPPDLPSLTGWRGRLLGEKLWGVARGRLSLRIGLDDNRHPILLESGDNKPSD